MLDNPETIQNATQFGVAGLMGALWLWERLYSRKREQQLTEAHEQLVAKQEALHVLTDLVKQNTVAIERFGQSQRRVAELLDRMEQERRAA